jgi:FkbM family methyltransferase
MPDRRGIQRVVNGDAFTLSPAFARAEALRSEWEPALYARFKAVIRPGMTVLDAGASFGLYTLAAGRLVGPAGRVYAFEPARRSASALRSHVAWNAVADRVEVVEAAVAERTGDAIFFEQETSFVASLVEAAARLEERRFAQPLARRRVPTVALDDFCAVRRLEPDVVKVDVEGAEASVLRGARELLRGRRARLFLEVHLRFAGDGASPEALGELAAAGWQWEQLGAELDTDHYECSPASIR